MNDIFEYLSPAAKPRTLKRILLLCACLLLGMVLAVVFVVYARFLLQFSYVFAALSLLGAMLLFLWLNLYTEIEYEYLVVSGEWQVDRVLGRRVRRNVYSIPTTSIVSVLPYDGTQMEGLRRFVDRGHTEHLYVVSVECDEGDQMILVHLPPDVYPRFCARCPRARRR